MADEGLEAVAGAGCVRPAQVRVVRPDAASNTGYQLGSEPGQAMFAKLCAPCHTIGKGNRVGPDLRGVADRREPAWLAQFKAETARLNGVQNVAAQRDEHRD